MFHRRKPTSEAPERMCVYVRPNHQAPFPVLVEPGDAVAKVKEAVRRATGIPVDEQRLYFAEQPLKDSCTLAECAVSGNCSLLLDRVVPGLRGQRQSTGSLGAAAVPRTGDRRGSDGELELRVNSLSGKLLLAVPMPGARTIADVKHDIRRRLGWPILEQRLISPKGEARVLRDDEMLRDVDGGSAIVQLNAIRISPDRARLLQDLSRGRRHLKQLSAELTEDPQVVVAAIQGGSATLEDAPEAVKTDRETMLQVLKIRGDLYTELPPILRADPKVALAALACSRDGSLLSAAPEQLRGDRKFMLQAVSWAGAALRYASPKLQDERPVVLAAVANDGLALRHASPSLRRDPAVQRTAAGSSARVLRQLIDP